MTTKQQEEMNKRFDKKFTYASFCWNGDNATGLKFAKATKRKVKSHLQSEIDLAVAEEKKRYQKYLLHHYENYGIESVIEILSIIKNNSTK